MSDVIEIRVPGDKSLTHRALILAALTDGVSTIARPLAGADTSSSASVLRHLGVAVPTLEAATTITVRGRGLHGLQPPQALLDCGNSGTTARLMMGVLAGFPFDSTLTGDVSLCSRPMRRVTVPLARMGAEFNELGEPDRLPVRIQGGTLKSLDYDSPHASAQVKSAILLAALTGGVAVRVTEPILSRDHTERMLARMGALVESREESDGRVSVALTPPDRLDPFTFEVPGDVSSAAFVAALGLLTARRPLRIVAVGLNPTRTGFIDVVRRMGGAIRIENTRESCGEPLGDIIVERSQLHATVITAAEVPSLVDEIPVIAMLAARARGTTRIEGAGELRVKESDRIHAVVSNLHAVGAEAEELPDGIVVDGSERALAGRVTVHHDHRIAMAFGVLAVTADAAIMIDDRAAVNVSYPDFWKMIDDVTRPGAA